MPVAVVLELLGGAAGRGGRPCIFVGHLVLVAMALFGAGDAVQSEKVGIGRDEVGIEYTDAPVPMPEETVDLQQRYDKREVCQCDALAAQMIEAQV